MARDYTLQRVPRQAQSQIDYAAELNDQQFAAVTAPPGPALVIAGAGSGKTRTLTYRVAYLLDNGIQARNILLLTFTNKAAREMLDRVEQLVPQDTRDIWGGTFHSIGNRILRRHAELVDRRPGFTIMDREDQKELMSSVVADSDVDPKAYRFPKPDVLLDIYSLAQNTGEDLDELIAWRYPYFDHLREPIKRVLAAYEKKKADINCMDFDDLLIKTLELLKENDALRESYQRQFEFVLVDEYQDTNHIQAELIDLLAGRSRNVMVVGDDAQSIYSWRGADFRNILEFPERYPGAQVYKIETNYRSVPEILNFANSAIAANREQFRKALSAHRPDRQMLPALVPVQDPNTQARFVAQRILELRDEGVELNEIAILYRAHFHSMEIQMELTNRGIPFVITSGLRFFEQAHIKDVAAFMKIASNRRDEVAFKRMVRMLPGIGDKSADKLWGEWLRSDLGSAATVTEFSAILTGFAVPAKAKSAWDQLAYTLDELVDAEGKPRRPDEMIPSIVEGVYDDYLRSKFSNYDSRRQDIEQLERYSEAFENIEEFLSQLSLLAGQDAVGATRQEPDAESVTLSSIHQAKGLEWRAVFLVWLADGMFPNNRVIDSDDDGAGLEEERRLFYVAATRAKDELYLIYPIFWPAAHSGDTLQRPSRFLEEVPSDLMEEWRVGAGW
ncbi:MAG: ATP-dependent helicase [Verrucomicrobiales bacterium]|nr:ATP-dependent helicase [Verrucomicrobiales bacterium]